MPTRWPPNVLFSICFNDHDVRLPRPDGRLDLPYRFPLCTLMLYPSTYNSLSWFDQRQDAATTLPTTLDLPPQCQQQVSPLAGHRQQGVAGRARPLEGELEAEAAPCPLLSPPRLSPSKVWTYFDSQHGILNWYLMEPVLSSKVRELSKRQMTLILDQSGRGCKFYPPLLSYLCPQLNEGSCNHISVMAPAKAGPDNEVSYLQW